MPALQERQLVGLDAMQAITTLLQRVRNAHPTDGLYAAAEMQWWWRVPRSTDQLAQLFWFDEAGRPEAGVITTDWGDRSSALYEATTLVVSVMPDASDDWLTHVIERGLTHANDSGIEAVELEVDRADDVTRDVLVARGFTLKEDGMVEAWLSAENRPEVSPLHEGYQLFTRTETKQHPHHFGIRNSSHEEERLLQTSLYNADLDLVVHDGNDDVAGYGLFWFDPVTATGVVEPMRTFDDHQRRGLARHILTAGIDRLVKAGAERISIGYEPGNPASGHLYRSVGFEPIAQSDVYSGPTGTPAS